MNRGRNESPESRRRRPRYLAAVEGLSNLLIFRTWPSGGAKGGSDLLAGVSAGAGARRMAEHPGSARHHWPHDDGVALLRAQRAAVILISAVIRPKVPGQQGAVARRRMRGSRQRPRTPSVSPGARCTSRLCFFFGCVVVV